jgi:hypothetical protein
VFVVKQTGKKGLLAISRRADPTSGYSSSPLGRRPPRMPRSDASKMIAGVQSGLKDIHNPRGNGDPGGGGK